MRNFQKILLYISLMNAAFVGHAHAFRLPEAAITVKVLDEDRNPVEGARVGIGFFTGGIAKEKAVVGFSDASGAFHGASGSVDVVGFNVSKEGYYKSFGEYHYEKEVSGKWQPWNPEVVIVLRRIEHPVPMYARRLNIEIPEIDKEVGFDLIEYDWVSPYGRGLRSDIIFKLTKQFKSRKEFSGTLQMSFPIKFDGIKVIKEDLQYGSQFKLPRVAPESGYQKMYIHNQSRESKQPMKDDYDSNNNYIFRVRSEERSGRLFRAMYGKIQGEISIDLMNSKTAYILFRYYLNPDYSRNLEYDPAQNLFLKLRDRRSLEWVGLE